MVDSLALIPDTRIVVIAMSSRRRRCLSASERITSLMIVGCRINETPDAYGLCATRFSDLDCSLGRMRTFVWASVSGTKHYDDGPERRFSRGDDCARRD